MERHQDEREIRELGRQWERQGLKRRDFLRLLAAGASTATVAGVLAACGGETPTTGTSANTTTTSAAAGAATTRTTGATTATTTAAQAAGTTRAGSPTTGPAGALGYPVGGQYSTLEQVGRRGGRLIEGTTGDARTMNPMISGDTSSNAAIVLMFNALVQDNPDSGLPFPDLATEVPTRENGGISADGLTYTFRLRPDVKWHDGRPLTARDVVFTYTTMAKPEVGSPRTSELNERVESVTAPDDSTVVFKLRKVVAPFLTDNMYQIAPEHILKDVPVPQIKEHPFSLGAPNVTIGTGPFKFQEWRKGEQLTLVKNPGYFRGEPALDQWIYRTVRDSSVVVAQLKTGELDLGGITESAFEEMSRQPNVTVNRFDTYSVTYYAYNLDPAKTSLFQDKRVRQALAYGLNREAMLQAIRLGIGRVAIGTMPALSWASAPDQIQLKYPYDPNRANQLLDEAGWRRGPDGIRAKDGQRLTFTLWTNSGVRVREQYITVMQQQWRAIGVEANPKTEEWNAFLARLNDTRDFEAYLSGFSFGSDPDQTSFWSCDSYNGGFNRPRYCNPRVDQLLAQALSELDQDRRKQLYVEMQNIIMDELPQFIFDWPQSLSTVNKRVHNLKPNAINTRWNAHTWWVEDGR